MELDMESEQVVRHGKEHGTVEMGKTSKYEKKKNNKQSQNNFKMKTKATIFFLFKEIRRLQGCVGGLSPLFVP